MFSVEAGNYSEIPNSSKRVCFEEAVKVQAKSADPERFRCKLQAVEAEDTEEGAKVVAEYEFFCEERFFVLKFRLVRSDNVFEFYLTKVF